MEKGPLGMSELWPGGDILLYFFQAFKSIVCLVKLLGNEMPIILRIIFEVQPFKK